jgi:hypothetical protein
MTMLRTVLLLVLLSVAGLVSADAPPMAIENGGRMEFVHAARSGKLSEEQRAALEVRLEQECHTPTNPITQGMIMTRGPAKCMAFVRNQCSCADCEIPTYCLPSE